MLNLVDFDTSVQRFAASARASTTKELDFTVGSLFRANAEAHAAAVLWQQWLILDVLRQTRLATSQGAEVDSYVGDFGVVRLPAVSALGSVILARYATGIAALVPVGATVQTLDGTQSFVVIDDTTNSAYSALSGGYNVDAGTSSVTVAVQAIIGGSAGNVQPGTVGVLTTAIPGIDTVTNTNAFTGGIDAESDDALKVRFGQFIGGLSKGTDDAIGYAIASTQQGLTYDIQYNQDTLGDYQPGNFVVTVDDGSGAPSMAIKNAVYAAVDAVRAATTTFSVRGPSIVTVNFSATITAATGYVKANLQGPVAAAVTAYLNGLQVGQGANYAKAAQVAGNVVGVGSITGLLLNGAQADIGVTAAQVIKAGTVAVN